MNEILKLSAFELSKKLTAGEISSVEVTAAHLERIKAAEPKVDAFLTVTEDLALSKAESVDALRAGKSPKDSHPIFEKAVVDNGGKLHPLAGVPIAIKDVVVTKGVQTTAGSRILEGWEPPYNATIMEKIAAAGLPILGKTNMDEFAMGSSTEHSGYKPTHNPWDLERIPGGSGGGSAVAVGSFEAPLAIGTDTGGSIRQPASVTGTVGVKPTYGAVSRYGLVALASSLDQAGPVTRTVLDAALLEDVISGYDERDSTSLKVPHGDVVEAALKGAKGDLKGVKVGVIKELSGDVSQGFQPGVADRFNESLKILEQLGAQIVEVPCPHFEYALGAYYLIMPSEASSNLAKFDGMRYGARVDGASAEKMMRNTRGEKFGDEVKRRIILGTYALSSGYYDAYYGSAQKVRTLIQRDFDAAFAKVDVLVSPTCPTTAFKLGDKLDDPLSMYLNDIATIPANLAGIPGISLPNGLAPAVDSSGKEDVSELLPSGIQILAPAQKDERLYLVGAALEAALENVWGGPILNRLPELGGKGAK